MNRSALDGVLVIDKPTGPTSHDIVACVRRTLGVKKVGHLGTLDPLATGVLPLVIGRATRLASLFADASKQYDAVIRLGLITDTYDITGTVVGGSDAPSPDNASVRVNGPPLPPEAITRAASGFVGSYPQRPPLFSAKRIDGVRAYDLARRRRPVEVTPARVTVETLSVLSIDGPRVRCRVVCSSGFYVRSLAHDLGNVLGCGGCLETLRRERHGPFGLAAAVPLRQVMEDGASVAMPVVPMDTLLPGLPAVVVTHQGARRAAHGNPLRAADIVDAAPIDSTETFAASSWAPGALVPPPDAAQVRVLDKNGRLLAIANQRSDGALHPKIVLV